MFDPSSHPARLTLVRARNASLRWRHGGVDVEHLLLGLLGDAEATAAKVLSHLGVDRLALLSACEGAMVPGDADPLLGQIPFTPAGRKVLEDAMREAELRGDRHIGTEHILLGILQAPRNRLSTVLASLPTSIEAVRAAVAAVVSG